MSTKIETFVGQNLDPVLAVEAAQDAANGRLETITNSKIISIAAQTLVTYNQGYEASEYTHIITIVHW